MDLDKFEIKAEPRIPDGKIYEYEIEIGELEQVAFENTDINLLAVCGFLKGDTRHYLYQFPNRGFENIIQLFGVGNRIGANDPDTDLLINQLNVINSKAPLVPYFADSSVFKLKVALPINDQLHQLIDKTLVHFAAEPMIDDDGYVGATIAQTGRLHFWWD